MRPRRVPFAMDYIEETVYGYTAAVKSRVLDSIELKWASDVLTQYFTVCSDVAALSVLELEFQCSKCSDSIPGEECFVPYCRDSASRPDISIRDLTQLAKYRRSVRWFLPDPVPREVLDQAIVVGGYSPSACNRQPFEFRIIDKPELAREVATIPMGTGGYAQNIPCFVVIVGKQRNYFSERDRHLIYIDGSLAAMSFIFALECQGVATCCINWPEILERDIKMAKFLKLEADERPVMCLAVGYPDPAGMVAYSAKKSLKQIRKYNFE